MVDEIKGIGNKKNDEPMAWKPWTPPVVPGAQSPQPAAPTPGAPAQPKGPAVRIQGDRNGTGKLNLEAAQRAAQQKVNVEQVEVPDGVSATPTLKDAATLLGELGVIAGISQVAAAYTGMPVSFGKMADSLGAFAENFGKVSEKLNALPGVGEALAAFGGVGGVAAGALGFKEELANIQQDGPNLGNGLGIASSAAQFMGGVATALSALAPPLAPLGATLFAASAALKMGKLGWEHRDKLKGTAKLISDKGAAIVSDKGAAIVGDKGAAIIGDRGAAIVANNSAAMSRNSFAWMTG